MANERRDSSTIVLSLTNSVNPSQVRTRHSKPVLEGLKVIEELVITDGKHHRNVARQRLHHAAPDVPCGRVQVRVADVA